MKAFSNTPEKPRQWYWCRRPNGFSALAKWRVIAGRLSMPAYQVIAFVNRLDEIANEGQERGYVGHFDPDEFGVDLGMPSEDAARIFAALEDGANPWIVSDHVANFYNRNPDREDPTANLRDRRRRVRGTVIKKLADLFRLGRISIERRINIEARLKTMPDEELFELPVTLAREELSTADHTTRGSRRETVRLTPEQSRPESPPAVDNFGDNASPSAGLSEDSASGDPLNPQQAAELWLATDGTRVVTVKMMEARPLAETRIARWRDQQLGGDAIALMSIIQAADATDYIGARFHNLIVDQIKRLPREGAAQAELRLPPVLASERKTG